MKSLRVAIEHTYKILSDNNTYYNIIKDYLGNELFCSSSDLKKALKVLNKNLAILSKDVIQNGRPKLKQKDGVVQKGYWKYVSEADTVQYLLDPIISLLGIKQCKEFRDGGFVYDSIIYNTDNNRSLVCEYKKLGYYMPDFLSLDEVKSWQLEKNRLLADSSIYLRGAIRKQEISYSQKAKNFLDNDSLTLVSNGFWYSLCLNFDSYFSSDNLNRIKSKYNLTTEGKYCCCANNVGIPLFSFNILEDDVDSKLQVMFSIIKHYLECDSAYSDIKSLLVETFSSTLLSCS